MKKFLPLLLLLISYTIGSAQSPGCNIANIRTAFTGAGYVELQVPTQPCSMYFINPASQSSAAAEAAAQQFGAHTVSFQTAQENQDVLNALYNSAYSPANYTIWMGLSDAAQEGNFIWLDGAPVTYTNWASGEPNDLHPSCCNIPLFPCNDIRCSQGEDCVQMYGDGSWNDLGCDVSSISLIEVNLCPVMSVSNDTTVCDGASVTLRASTILGSTPYTYTWNPGSSSSNPYTVTPPATTTTPYTVSVTDRWGCYQSATVNVTSQNCAPPPVSTCNITAIRSAFTGAGYVELPVANEPCSMYFINPASQSSTAAEAAAQQFGAHMVSFQSAQENQDLVNALNASPYPLSSYAVWIGFTDAAQEGTFIWLDGAPVTYTNWASGEPNNLNPGTCCSIPSWLGGCNNDIRCSDGEDCVQMYSNGTWNDLGCDGSGNPSISVIEVNLCPLLTSTNDTTVCGGNPVNLSVSTIFGSTPYSYNWQPGNSSANPYQVTPIATTDYVVSVTDRWGCAALDTVSVTVQSGGAQTFTLSPNPVCENNAVTVTYTGPSPAGANYTWGFDGGTVASGSGQGPYQVTWTGSGTKNITLDVVDNGCTSPQVTQPLTINPSPVANAGADVTVCSGGVAQLGAANVAGYTYVWTPATNLSATNISNPTYTFTNTTGAPVTTQYILNVTQNGCPDADTVQVTVGVPQPTTISTTGNVTAICNGNTITISSDSVYAAYLWSDNSTGSSITVGQAGTYALAAADANGCQYVSNPLTITINPSPVPVLVSSTNESCFGAGDGDITVDGSNSIAPYTFAWNTSPQQTTATATALSAGSYDVTVTDGNSCTGSATFSITSPTQLAINLVSITDVSCYGYTDGSIQLSATGGTSPYTYLWSNTAQGPALSNVAEGTYDVTLTDANNCTETDSYVVGSPTEIVLTVDDITDASCFGYSDGSITVSAVGGSSPYSFDWSNNSSGNMINNIPAGDYTVSVSDANNCEVDTMVTVSEPDQLIFSNSDFDSIKFNTTVPLTIDVQPTTNTYTYNWNPGTYLSCTNCASPDFSAIHSIVYQVQVTDQNGCTVAGTVKVSVLSDKQVFIPNAFTPNNDFNNDVFYVYANGVAYFHLTIFNRWGEKVFESNNITEGWDGIYAGKDAMPGVYVYNLTLTFLDGESTKYKGTVTLLK